MSLQAKINYPKDKEGFEQMVRKADIKIETSYDGMVRQVNFLGKELFYLMASRFRGITAEAINVPRENIECYNYSYSIGGLKGVNDEAPLIEIKKVNEDARGSIHAVLYKGVEVYNLNAINPFFMRGAHDHPYDVQFNIVSGEGVWLILRDGVMFKEEQKAGEKKIINTGEMHSFIATQPTLLTEVPAAGVTGEKFQARNDNNARELMNEFNSKQESFNKMVSEMLRQN